MARTPGDSIMYHTARAMTRSREWDVLYKPCCTHPAPAPPRPSSPLLGGHLRNLYFLRFSSSSEAAAAAAIAVVHPKARRPGRGACGAELGQRELATRRVPNEANDLSPGTNSRQRGNGKFWKIVGGISAPYRAP